MDALVYLDIQLQAYSQNEIIERIPKNIFDEIKSKDEHPFFQMYSIIHEGTSQPKILGRESKPITWFREAIQSVKNVIKKGIKFFAGHNSTNDNQDKKVLGEIIHAFEEEIDNKLHHCVIGYFPPDTRDEAKKMDICSQEAEWNLLDISGKLVADTCKKITGIALANSKDSQPAFSGARRLAYVQAFEIQAEGNSEPPVKQEKKIMTYEEIKTAIASNFEYLPRLAKDLRAYPSQLYTIDEIKKDREFASSFDEYEKAKTDLKTKEDELTKVKDENSKLNKSILSNSAKDKLKTLYKDLQLTENIQVYVNKAYEKYKEKIEDFTEEGLKKFVENYRDIYQDVKSIENKNDINIPSGDNPPNVNPNDATKKDNNPFLDEDFIVD